MRKQKKARQQMMKLNKLGYQQLIDEDIAWLEKIPRTLEREHIIAVLKASVEHEYPTREPDDDDVLTIQNRKSKWNI